MSEPEDKSERAKPLEDLSEEEVKDEFDSYIVDENTSLRVIKYRLADLTERIRRRKAEKTVEIDVKNYKAFYGELPEKEPLARLKDLLPPEQQDDSFDGKSAEYQWRNYPPDLEQWEEKDIGEVWIDPPRNQASGAYDPTLGITGMEEYFSDRMSRLQSNRFGESAIKRRLLPKNLPNKEFYTPFRRQFPHFYSPRYEDSSLPETALQRLEMVEMFLDWDSYVFQNGSSYEGTTWNDLAQGKGVYKSATELTMYEGEWVRNMMDGHGVVTIHIPKALHHPQLRSSEAEGGGEDSIQEEFQDALLNEDDKKWLQMHLVDIENKVQEVRKGDDPDSGEDSFDEFYRDGGVQNNRKFWKKKFGSKPPPKGRYQYAGQLKFNKMHGCGVYSINERKFHGKWYFGKLLEDPEECDLEMSAFHAGMAEVAASKARMFTNKPDGMVREIRGPYTDPSHAYMYDEEDMWMAPGFVNEFHEVPHLWANYVAEVDEERQMWLNSFTQAPLRLPMPPELEAWWQDEDEFVVLCDPEGVDKERVLLHVPTGKIINWNEDENGEINFFVQPVNDNGEVDAETAQVEYLPDGIEECLNGTPLVDETVLEQELEDTPANKMKKVLDKKRDIAKRKLELKRSLREEERKEILQEKAELLLDCEEERAVKLEAGLGNLRLAKESIALEAERLQRDAKRLLLGEKGVEEAEEVTEEVEVVEVEARDESRAKSEVDRDTVEEEEVEEVEEVEKEEEEKEAVGVKQGVVQDEVKAPLEEAEEKEVEEEEEVEEDEDEDEDEDDEDEDDGKGPRSFGTVAMAGGEEAEREWKKGSEEGRGNGGGSFPFGSVFASLTLSSQVNVHSALKSAFASAKALLSKGKAAGEGRRSAQPSIPGAERKAPPPMFVALPCPQGRNFRSLGIRGGSRGRVLSGVPGAAAGKKRVQRGGGGSSTNHYSDAGSGFQYPVTRLTSLSLPVPSVGRLQGDRAESSRVVAADRKQ